MEECSVVRWHSRIFCSPCPAGSAVACTWLPLPSLQGALQPAGPRAGAGRGRAPEAGHGTGTIFQSRFPPNSKQTTCFQVAAVHIRPVARGQEILASLPSSAISCYCFSGQKSSSRHLRQCSHSHIPCPDCLAPTEISFLSCFSREPGKTAGWISDQLSCLPSKYPARYHSCIRQAWERLTKANLCNVLIAPRQLLRQGPVKKQKLLGTARFPASAPTPPDERQ